MTNFKNLEVEISSDVYCAGKTEDGYPYTAEVFYVVAVFPNGRRIAHSSTFRSCEVEQNEEGYNIFISIKDEAFSKVERLCSRIQKCLVNGGKLDMTYWDEINPVYGSDYYINSGEEENVMALEKMWDEC